MSDIGIFFDKVHRTDIGLMAILHEGDWRIEKGIQYHSVENSDDMALFNAILHSTQPQQASRMLLEFLEQVGLHNYSFGELYSPEAPESPRREKLLHKIDSVITGTLSSGPSGR